MYKTASQIYEAIRAIVESDGYELLKNYKEDFYTHDRVGLDTYWSESSRAIWVVTPNGTHLNFVGHHKKQIDAVQASVSTGYSSTEVYLLNPEKGVVRITDKQATEEAKRLDYHLSGNMILGKDGGVLAYMSMDESRAIRNTARVHFEPAESYTGSKGQLSALNSIALYETIDRFQTLFVRVERITVGDALLLPKGLVYVPNENDDFKRSVIFNRAEFEPSGKGFRGVRGNWTSLSKACLLDRAGAMAVTLGAGQEMIPVREARFRLALREHCQA